MPETAPSNDRDEPERAVELLKEEPLGSTQVREIVQDSEARRRICYHECGHAIVARRLGLRIDKIILTPVDPGSALPWEGNVPVSDPTEKGVGRERFLRVALAGLLAEARYVFDRARKEHAHPVRFGKGDKDASYSAIIRAYNDQAEGKDVLHVRFLAGEAEQVVTLPSDKYQADCDKLYEQQIEPSKDEFCEAWEWTAGQLETNWPVVVTLAEKILRQAGPERKQFSLPGTAAHEIIAIWRRSVNRKAARW